MKIGSWDFEALSEAYGVEIIGRRYLPSEGRWPALNVLEIDLDDLPDGAQFRMARHNVDGFEYHVFRYKGRMIAGRTYSELEPTAEDLAEWQAASSGCGYYTFVGQPWRD